jgi:hypothetical protein
MVMAVVAVVSVILLLAASSSARLLPLSAAFRFRLLFFIREKSHLEIVSFF